METQQITFRPLQKEREGGREKGEIKRDGMRESKMAFGYWKLFPEIKEKVRNLICVGVNVSWPRGGSNIYCQREAINELKIVFAVFACKILEFFFFVTCNFYSTNPIY